MEWFGVAQTEQRKDGKTIMMLRRPGPGAVAILMLMTAGLSLRGQTSSRGTAGADQSVPEKTYERLPGLDKRLIDTSANPCADFFQYACGNFTKLYPIPKDLAGFGMGTMVTEYTEHAVQTLLEKAARGG